MSLIKLGEVYIRFRLWSEVFWFLTATHLLMSSFFPLLRMQHRNTTCDRFLEKEQRDSRTCGDEQRARFSWGSLRQEYHDCGARLYLNWRKTKGKLASLGNGTTRSCCKGEDRRRGEQQESAGTYEGEGAHYFGIYRDRIGSARDEIGSRLEEQFNGSVQVAAASGRVDGTIGRRGRHAGTEVERC